MNIAEQTCIFFNTGGLAISSFPFRNQTSIFLIYFSLEGELFFWGKSLYVLFVTFIFEGFPLIVHKALNGLTNLEYSIYYYVG